MRWPWSRSAASDADIREAGTSGNVPLIEPTPVVERLRRYHDGKPSKEGGFSFWVAVCFTINYIMGCGFLGVPRALHEAGIAFGACMMVLVTLAAMLSKTYLLETMCRAEALTRAALVSSEPDAVSPHTQASAVQPKYMVSERKFEVVELCRMFFGRRGKLAYVTLLNIYMYGSLWSYAAVFSRSFSENLPLNDHSYKLYLLMFGAVVVCISCLELREQIVVQVIMSAARVLVVVGMVCTVVVALVRGGDSPFEGMPAADSKQWSWFRLHGIPYMLPILVYSQVMHHSVPVLSQPVRDKSRLASIFNTALSITGTFYVSIGILLAFYFGSVVDSQCNMNWSHYMGRHAPATARVLSSMVMLFPAIDVLSAYPLGAITLGNNLMAAILSDRIEKKEQSKWAKIPFRLLASVPPLIGASVVHELGRILDFAGLIGFGICFHIPSLLQLASRRACERRFGGADVREQHGRSGVNGNATVPLTPTLHRPPRSDTVLLAGARLGAGYQTVAEEPSEGEVAQRAPLLAGDIAATPYSLSFFSRPAVAWCLIALSSVGCVVVLTHLIVDAVSA